VSVSINRLTDEFVVLAMCSDPELMHPFFRGGTVQANAHAPHFAAAKVLEVQRRVAGVGLKQRETLAREQLHIQGKRIKALPEAL